MQTTSESINVKSRETLVDNCACSIKARLGNAISQKHRHIKPDRSYFQMQKMPKLHLLLAGLAFMGVKGGAEGGVFEGNGISTMDCDGEDCATLYLITSGGVEVAHKGTSSKIKQKDVEKAKVVGSGCFMIYKGKGFSGPSIKIEGASPLTLKEQGHSWTTVK